MNIWFVPFPLLLVDQHWPMWWLRVPVLAKPQDTMQVCGMLCPFVENIGRRCSMALSSQASLVSSCFILGTLSQWWGTYIAGSQAHGVSL